MKYKKRRKELSEEKKKKAREKSQKIAKEVGTMGVLGENKRKKHRFWEP